MPAAEHLAAQSSANRQGRGEVLDGAERRRGAGHDRGATPRRPTGATSSCSTRTRPAQPLDPARAGLARELARMVLPLNTYTEWYWKTDLHNLLHFIALRADPHAQYEIRAYAAGAARRGPPLGAADLRGVRGLPPERRRAVGQGARRRCAGCSRARRSTQADSGLSAREWRELQALLGPD